MSDELTRLIGREGARRLQQLIADIEQLKSLENPTAGGSGAAPNNAQYLVLALNANLTQERVVTLTAPLGGVDGGADGNYTISVAAATTGALGIGEIATQVEVDAGVDTTRWVTPATLAGSSFAALVDRVYDPTLTNVIGQAINDFLLGDTWEWSVPAIFNDAAYFSEYLRHDGDTDTNIRYTDDKITFNAGAVELLALIEAGQDEVVVNDGGVDVDFRVESDNDANALIVRGSDGFLGLGIAAPTARLHLDETYTDATPHNAITVAQVWSPASTSGSVFPTAMILTPKYDTTHTPAGGFLTSFRLFAEIEDSGVLSIRNVDMLSTNDGAGTVASIHDLHLRAVVNSGGGAITEYTALLIEASTAAVSNYGIRQLGSGTTSYFEGLVGVGASPAAANSKFQVFDAVGGQQRVILQSVGAGPVTVLSSSFFTYSTCAINHAWRDSGGSVGAGHVTVTSGAGATIVMGAGTWTLTFSAGSLVATRTAGAGTVTAWAFWITHL